MANHAPANRRPGQAPPGPPSFQYFKVGSWIQCEVNGKHIICYVDDVTTHARVWDAHALFFVNAPFSAGSLQKYLRQAAQTTHGVKHAELIDVYTAIHGLVRDGDGVAWLIPNRPGVIEFFQDWKYNIIENVCGEEIHLAVTHNVFDLVHSKIGALRNLHKNDNYANFDIIFKGCDLSKYEFIFDPCAGWGPLMKTAVERNMGYYGVEISSIKGLNVDRISRFVEKCKGKIIAMPEAVAAAPDRIVAGAVGDQYLDEKDIPDLTVGRIIAGKIVKRK